MSNISINIFSILVSMILSHISIPYIFNMLKNSNCLCLNYRKEEIPISMGLLFIIIQTFTCIVIVFIKKQYETLVMIYLASFILIGLVGLLDDLIGDTKVKGFKGHISCLFKGILTTGGLKAVTGFLISFLISLIVSKNIFEILMNTLIISLFTNLINLFDLRPGRASKVFLLFSIILLITSKLNELNFILFSFFGILIRYLPIDLKAEAMMGDIGSNSLGITLGIYCVLTHSFKAKIIYLIALIVFQVLSEIISFSKVIDENKFFKFIDNIGR